jgi:energy-coupling factor transporter ATP-binding protein EcfA2
LGDILNVTPEPGFDPSRGQLPDMKGEIQFEQVNFRYSVEGRCILNDIQLKIHAGERIGIVGPSGSGKSTLSQLVQRMYVPDVWVLQTWQGFSSQWKGIGSDYLIFRLATLKPAAGRYQVRLLMEPTSSAPASLWFKESTVFIGKFAHK